ncbi:MAG: hypothetical protein FWG80_04415 [Alphaproteobacteria bacterium]|nr:hypothetical protein [Alphaproteobacteria bacterium]
MPSKKHAKKTTAKKQHTVKPAVAKNQHGRIAAVAHVFTKSMTRKSKDKASAKPVSGAVQSAPAASDNSRFALYVYWIIILFFVSATCYIMGRSYSILNPNRKSDSVVAEAALINVSGMSESQRADLFTEYASAGKRKLLDGNATGAILDLTVAIEANPKIADVYVYRGESYMQVADYTRAMFDLNKAIELDSSNSIAYYDRAMLNMRLENLEKALEDLNSALEANANRPSEILSNHDIYAKRAQLLLWARQFNSAVNDYTAAINASANRQNPDDYAGRAEAWTMLSEFRHAASDYLSAISLISEQIHLVDTSEEREKMSRAAMSYFEKSAALNVKMGDMNAARTDLEAAHSLAATLGDNDTANRLQSLILGL